MTVLILIDQKGDSIEMKFSIKGAIRHHLIVADARAEKLMHGRGGFFRVAVQFFQRISEIVWKYQ
jgi:hypothetical protein